MGVKDQSSAMEFAKFALVVLLAASPAAASWVPFYQQRGQAPEQEQVVGQMEEANQQREAAREQEGQRQQKSEIPREEVKANQQREAALNQEGQRQQKSEILREEVKANQQREAALNQEG